MHRATHNHPPCDQEEYDTTARPHGPGGHEQTRSPGGGGRREYRPPPSLPPFPPPLASGPPYPYPYPPAITQRTYDTTLHTYYAPAGARDSWRLTTALNPRPPAEFPPYPPQYAGQYVPLAERYGYTPSPLPGHDNRYEVYNGGMDGWNDNNSIHHRRIHTRAGHHAFGQVNGTSLPRSTTDHYINDSESHSRQASDAPSYKYKAYTPSRPADRELSRFSPSPSSQSRSGPSSRSSKKTRPKGQVFLPSPEYIALSHPSNAFADPPRAKRKTKLVVLDLNGALVYRSGTKTSYPRPYLGNFLSYIFTPESASPSETPFRPWEAFVWSSAQPQNVRLMVENTFGLKWIEGVYEEEDPRVGERRRRNGEGRLLGVWARDKMALSSSDYHQHVQTYKDLRVLHDAISKPLDIPSSSDIHAQSLEFDETDTILIDDSTAKAVHQPWNHLCIPEYDIDEHEASRAVAFGLGADQTDRIMDEYLICVVGIMDVLREVDNVPAWIRGGGLVNSGEWSGSVGVESPTIEGLPGHKSFGHWYEIPRIVRYWRQKGVEALERKGIQVEHGLTMDTPNGSGRQTRAGTPGRHELGTPSRQSRGSTPSRYDVYSTTVETRKLQHGDRFEVIEQGYEQSHQLLPEGVNAYSTRPLDHEMNDNWYDQGQDRRHWPIPQPELAASPALSAKVLKGKEKKARKKAQRLEQAAQQAGTARDI